MRPGEPPTLESSHALFQSLFFNSDRYDLSSVGWVKMNSRLDMETDDNLRILRKQDIMAILKVIVGLKDGQGDIDDIDHLGNRRVRSVGELMENQYRIGLLRMERAIRERMGSVEIDTVMPADLINASQLLQFVNFLVRRSCHNSWTRQTLCRKLPTSAEFQPLGRGAN